MIDDFQMTFHHIGKPVPLESIKDNKNTKYSPLFDMYSLDMKNDLSIPIELHAFGENSSLDVRIQKEPHVALKQITLRPLYRGKKLSCHFINHSPGTAVQWL